MHRPDFLCIEDGRVILIECKSLDGIADKNARNPGFFEFVGGRWKCPPAADEARKFGFDYEVWTELDFGDIELRNATCEASGSARTARLLCRRRCRRT